MKYIQYDPADFDKITVKKMELDGVYNRLQEAHDRIAELEALVEDAYREGWSDGDCSDGANRNVRDEDWKGSMTRATLKGTQG